jgi:hypothetical protein
VAARITPFGHAQAASLATRLPRCGGLDAVDDIAAIVKNGAGPRP